MNIIDISVIVRCFNSEATIKKALDSISSDKLNIEVVVIDDGSTDRTKDIIDDYQWAQNVHVAKIYNEHKGVFFSTRIGVEKSNGKYITFLDSDDYFASDALSTLFLCAEESCADMVQCEEQFEDIKGNEVSKKSLNDDQVILGADALQFLLNGSSVIKQGLPCKLYKKAVFNDLCWNYVEAYEDVNIMYQIVWNCNRIVCMAKKLYHTVLTDNSITRRPFRESYYTLFEIYNRMEDEIRKRSVNDVCIKYAIEHQYAIIVYCFGNAYLQNKQYNGLIKRIKKDARVLIHKRQLSIKKRIILIIMLVFPSVFNWLWGWRTK